MSICILSWVMIEQCHQQLWNWKNYVTQLFSGIGQQKTQDIILQRREMHEVSYTSTLIFSWEVLFPKGSGGKRVQKKAAIMQSEGNRNQCLGLPR